MEAKNLAIRKARLAELGRSYSLEAFWSFAHPAIY
jgi:hypothetical protein